jgi:glycosyltransferase involved in cell wall biosynthesis
VNKKLNILFLSSWYPNKVQPSNGNFIQQHAQAVSIHCNVYALHIISRNQDEDIILEQNLNEGVLETIVYYKKVTSKVPFLNLLLKQIIRRKAHQIGYQKILEKTKKIDLTHLNICFPAGLFALYLKNKFNIPYIISENWTVLLDSDPTTFNPIEQFLVNRINQKADLLCPVSMDLQKALTRIAPYQKFKIIPNVVNTTKFEQNLTYQCSNTVKILHVSNLKDEHKNITGILNVVKRLSSKNISFKITIAGNGDTDYFRRKANKLQIPDGLVSFEKEKTREEVAQLMNSHDFFLLFSNYENLPCVVVESLSVGLPVLATDVGGTAEMINENNGIIIDSKNEKQLEEQLISFIANISKYDRIDIGKQARKIYSYETISRQFLDIYKEILKN